MKTKRVSKRIEIFPQVRAGEQFSLFLSPSGDVHSFGLNEYGELGQGDKNERKKPTLIKYFSDRNIKIIKIKVSCSSSYFLSRSKKWYCCGRNDDYDLGLKHKKEVTSPTPHDFFEKKNVISIKLGGGFNLFYIREDDGKSVLYGCGYKRSLGIDVDKEEYTSSPVRISFFDNKEITKISCGGSGFFIAQTNDGKLYGTGKNESGQLSLGELTEKSDECECSVRSITFFSKKGIKIDNFSCGATSSYFISRTRIFSCGYNFNGELGFLGDERICVPREISFLKGKGISRVFCGGNTAFFVSSDGRRVYGCGKSDEGQLGVERDDEAIRIPESVTIKFSSEHEKIVNISSDLEGTFGHSFIVTSFGRIFGTGCNKYGQLSFSSSSEKFEIAKELGMITKKALKQSSLDVELVSGYEPTNETTEDREEPKQKTLQQFNGKEVKISDTELSLVQEDLENL